MITPLRTVVVLGLIAQFAPAIAVGQQASRKIPLSTAKKTVVKTDSMATPWSRRVIPVLPDALLPQTRIVAFYGTPLSARMGILGELSPEKMLAKLDSTAKEWARADTSHTVRAALHLIATVAQGHSGADAKYRLRAGDSLIARVASWAEQRGWLLFLDIQPGRSDVEQELPRLLPWLKKPWVHLALDPEFAMPEGRVPGIKIGSLDARDINYAIAVLANLVTTEHLPPKVLVVHRFTMDMLTNYKKINSDPRVQVVIDADGFGSPPIKKHIFDLVVVHQPVQFAGLKLFYKNDAPMMTFSQILALRPVPLYIQYQ